MDSGNSSSGGDGDGSATAGDVHFTHMPILQPPSNFFNPSSFSHPPNPNPNSIYTLNYSNLIHDPNPVDNSANNDDPNPNFGPEKSGVTAKNPKKRTRASRRAPTTVMITDTANFRQMVKEFTGIRAAPFSSPGYSSRREFYGGSAEQMAVPIQPVRPSAYKIVQFQPYLNSVTSSTSNFHLPPSESHLFTKQPLSLQNLQNQMFPFQSGSQSLQPTVSQQFDNNNNNNDDDDNQRLEPLSGFVGSSSASLKRWRGESENLLNYEGVNGNSQNVVVPSSDGEQPQLAGNEDTWSF